MSEYLTYAAVKTSNIKTLLEQCKDVAKKLGIRFEVPMGISAEAHTWLGVFHNGWTFALADPAVWELLDLFSRLSRDIGYPCLSGSTDGDFRKWSYDYAEHGEVQHRFVADPSTRYAESQYPALKGNAAALAETFGASLARINTQLRQFSAPPVQEFLDTLGFDVNRTSMLRFVVIAPGKFDGPSTLSVVVSSESVKAAVEAARGEDPDTSPAGVTTKAFKAVTKAASQGYGEAAKMRAARFAAESEFNEVHDLFFRLRRERHWESALAVADGLVARATGGEFSTLPSPHREIREATIYGLRGLALFDQNRLDEAVFELRDRALAINRYVGPQHRASYASILGDVLVRLRRYDEALDPLRLCLAERPLHAKTWANLAFAAGRSGRTAEARQAVLLGIASDPDLPEWPPLKASLGITDDELLPERKPEQSRARRHAAQDLMKRDKLQAVPMFRIALHHSPTDIDCAWGLACAIVESYRDGLQPLDKNDFEVIRLLEQVCFGNPAWPWSWGTLIEIFEMRGERKRALEAAEAYATLHATRIEDLQNVANWVATIRPEIGIYLLRQLLKRFVDLRMQGNVGGVDRGNAQFKALSMLGWALLQTGQAQEALQPLTEAIQFDSGNVDNLANLADAHLRVGNAAAASRNISRGLRINPNHQRLNALSKKLRG